MDGGDGEGDGEGDEDYATHIRYDSTCLSTITENHHVFMAKLGGLFFIPSEFLVVLSIKRAADLADLMLVSV